MCERCARLDADEFQATALLRMIISKIHARCDADGAMEFEKIKLTPSEADWLCAWGAENEDMEDADPLEEDTAPEESEQLESDSRIGIEPVETKPARRIKR
jgi:hypothetical protein